MDRAYVLIKTLVGETERVAAELKENGLFQPVDIIVGPYDILAGIEAEDLNHIGRIVMGIVSKVPGLETTITCPVIEEED